jgi:hypothetical protein
MLTRTHRAGGARPIISVDDIDALMSTYARGGAEVTYHRDQFCDHLLLHPLSAPMTTAVILGRSVERQPLSKSDAA